MIDRRLTAIESYRRDIDALKRLLQEKKARRTSPRKTPPTRRGR